MFPHPPDTDLVIRKLVHDWAVCALSAIIAASTKAVVFIKRIFVVFLGVDCGGKLIIFADLCNTFSFCFSADGACV